MQNHNWPEQPLQGNQISLTWGGRLSNHQMKKQKLRKIKNKIAKKSRQRNRKKIQLPILYKRDEQIYGKFVDPTN